MLEIKVKLSHDYLLLSDIEKLTPKIPKLTAKQKGPDPICWYTVEGLSSEDELYIMLKYNGKVISEFREVDPV